MSDKNKYYIWLFMFSLFLIIGSSIDGIGTPGDYILRSLGLAVWSQGTTGVHMIAIYMITPIMIGLFEIGIYRRKLEYGRLKTFILFVIILMSMKTMTVYSFEFVKGQSEGLLAVGFVGKDSGYRIEQNREEASFDIKVNLRNYSDEKQKFTMTLNNRRGKLNEDLPLEIYDLYGEKAYFELGSRETRVYHITPENYVVQLAPLSESYSSSSRSGQVSEVILGDSTGSVRLSSEHLKGIVLEVYR